MSGVSHFGIKQANRRMVVKKELKRADSSAAVS